MPELEMKHGEPTGIDVLIVGGGLGGLMAAVEMVRQGHNARVLEAKPEIEGLGEFISFPSHGVCLNRSSSRR